MKNTLKFSFAVLLLVSLTACLGTMGPSEKTEEFLNRYIKNDKAIMEELDTYLLKQDLTSVQRERYKNIIKDEYSNIEYEILSENVSDALATVEVNISVKDLFGASNKAEEDLVSDPTKFYTEGIYDASKFIDYKLDIMENYKDKKNYTIFIKLNKNEDLWQINEIDDETLEKIHGIYDYTK